MIRTARPLAALLVAASALAVGAPALAATGPNNVNVLVGVETGKRQFEAENLDGTKLQTLDLSETGTKAFRTRVYDTNFAALSGSYSVKATMSDLYREDSAQQTGRDVNTKIGSDRVSITYGETPLSIPSLDVTLAPVLNITGTLASCGNLDSGTKTLLGLDAGGVPVLGTVLKSVSEVLAMTQLCNALGTGQAISGAVDGTLRTVTATGARLLDLPTKLTGARSGAFTVADYTQDVTGKVDPAATGAQPTARTIMSGAPATELGVTVAEQLKGLVQSQVATLPLASADGAGAATTLGEAMDVVFGSVGSTLDNALAALNVQQKLAIVNQLTGVAATAPLLGQVRTLTGNYLGFPVLTAERSAPVAGTYAGTLTLTFTQS